MRVSVSDLKPGMKSADWEFISNPRMVRHPDERQARHVIAIDARHRIDRGESTVHYEAYDLVEVED